MNRASAARPRWLERYGPLLLLGAILLLGAGLRLYGLDQQVLWGDEVASILESEYRLQTYGFFNLLRYPNSLLAFIGQQLGQNEAAIRFPFALVGIASIPAIYALGWALFGKREGLIAALLLAISPFHIRYSQEVRYYALIVFLSITAALFLYLALEKNGVLYWAGFAIAGLFGVLNVSAGLFPLASLAVFGGLALLFEGIARWRCARRAPDDRSNAGPRRRMSWRALIPSQLPAFLISLLFIALLGGQRILTTAQQVSPMGEATAPRKTADIVLFEPSLTYFRGLFADFTTGWGEFRGRIDWTLFAALAFFCGGLLACLIHKQRKQALLLAVWMVLPPAILSIIGFQGLRVGVSRHLIFLLPIYMVGLARGIGALGDALNLPEERLARTRGLFRRVTFAITLAAFAGVAVAPILGYYQSQREDWRAAASFLRERVQPGDLIFQLSYLWKQEGVAYYMRPWLADSQARFIHLLDLGEVDFQDAFPTCVWWVFSLSPHPEELARLKASVGPSYEIVDFPSTFRRVVLLHQRTALDLDAFSLTAAELILVQAQLDDPAYLDTYMRYLIRARALYERQEAVSQAYYDWIATGQAGCDTYQDFLAWLQQWGQRDQAKQFYEQLQARDPKCASSIEPPP